MGKPIYIFTGLMESGKTSFLKAALHDPEFTQGNNIILACEDGEISYDEAFLASAHAIVIPIMEEELLTTSYLQEIEDAYHPDQIFIEYNGMWNFQKFMHTVVFPKTWDLAQILGTIDATSFSMYLKNLKAYLYDQLQSCEIILINRCTKDMKKSFLRSNIKAMNRSCQIIYEDIDGGVNQLEEDEIVFDMDGDILDIHDNDYGLWYMDAFDQVDKYIGKKIKIRGNLHHNGTMNSFVLVREAMVCCEEDISSIALLCKSSNIMFQDGEMFELTGYIVSEYEQSIQADMPVLKVQKQEQLSKLEQEYIYFN